MLTTTTIYTITRKKLLIIAALALAIITILGANLLTQDVHAVSYDASGFNTSERLYVTNDGGNTDRVPEGLPTTLQTCKAVYGTQVVTNDLIEQIRNPIFDSPDSGIDTSYIESRLGQSVPVINWVDVSRIVMPDSRIVNGGHMNGGGNICSSISPMVPTSATVWQTTQLYAGAHVNLTFTRTSADRPNTSGTFRYHDLTGNCSFPGVGTTGEWRSSCGRTSNFFVVQGVPDGFEAIASETPLGCGYRSGTTVPGTICPDGSIPVVDNTLPPGCPGSALPLQSSPGTICPERPGRPQCTINQQGRCLDASGRDVTQGGYSDPPNQSSNENETDPGALEGDPTRIGCPYTNPLNWVVCPFVTGAMSAISAVDIAVNNLLNIGTEQIFDDSTETGEAYRTAWGIFRTFALAFIVIAALVMVISQAAGLEILDAYTIRKVLPRLLIAAIGITLSWELMEASVILFNDLGLGVRDIIRAPFDDAFREAAQLSVGSTFIILLLTTGAIFSYGIMALLGFVVIILIAVLAAYAMLVLREIVIILLVMLSPIFIALYVLPNTQKFSNIGFRAFFGLLLAYPMVMGTIAVGDVFSVVAASSEVGSITGATQMLGVATFSVSHAALASGTLAVGELFGQGNAGQVAGVAAFIGTRAAIVPILARSYAMAGAVGGFIGGLGSRAAQGLTAPVRGWQKKRGASVRGNRLERARTGNFFKREDTGPRWARQIKRRTNTALSAAGHAGDAGFNPLRWRSRIREGVERTTEKQRDAMAKDDDWTWQSDDDLNRAAAESDDEGDLRRTLLGRYGARYGWNGTTFTDPAGEKNLNRDLARVRRMKEKYGNSTFRQAAHLKAVRGGAAYHSAADPYVAVARIAGDNAGLRANLVGLTRSEAAAAGMQQQAAMSFGTALDVTTAIHHGLDSSTASSMLRADVARSAEPHQITRGKLRSTTAIAHAHAERIAGLLGSIGQVRDFKYFDADGKEHTDSRPVEDRDVKQAIGAAMGILDGLGGTASVHGAAFADSLMSMGVTRQGASAIGITLGQGVQGTTLSELFDMGLRDDQHIREVRREFATAAQQQQNQGQGQGQQQSDRRLKRAIRPIGIHSTTGIPLYQFKYKWSEQYYIGVMAQDLLESHPEAISVGSDGYYMVDYDMIGVEFKVVDRDKAMKRCARQDTYNWHTFL